MYTYLRYYKPLRYLLKMNFKENYLEQAKCSAILFGDNAAMISFTKSQ